MKQNNQKITIANKIKKWIKTTKEVENSRFAISITRLTSIKSLCASKIATEKFALYIAKRVQQQMNQATCPEHFSAEEWNQQKQLVDEAIDEVLQLILRVDASDAPYYICQLRKSCEIS